MSLVDEEAFDTAYLQWCRKPGASSRVLIELYEQYKYDNAEERLGAECQFSKTLKKAGLLKEPLPKLPKPVYVGDNGGTSVTEVGFALNQIIDYLTALEKQRG